MARKKSIILGGAELEGPQARGLLPRSAPPAPKAPTARTVAKRRKLPALKNPLLMDP